VVPIWILARYDRPAPSLAGYDQLLSSSEKRAGRRDGEPRLFADESHILDCERYALIRRCAPIAGASLRLGPSVWNWSRGDRRMAWWPWVGAAGHANDSSPWSDFADQGELGESGYSAAEFTVSEWMDQKTVRLPAVTIPAVVSDIG
jgi:hypothetical protein